MESGLASVSLSLTFALSSLVVVDVILFNLFFHMYLSARLAREALMRLSCMSAPRGSVSDSRVVSAVYQ